MALKRVERKRRYDQVSCKVVLAHKAYIPNFTFDPVAPCIFSEYVIVSLILPPNSEVPREFWLLPRPFKLPICSVIQWRDAATTSISSYLKGRELTWEPDQLLSVWIEDINTSWNQEVSPTRIRSFASPIDSKLANLSNNTVRSVAHPWAMTGCRPSSLLELSIMLPNSPWRIWCGPNLQNMNHHQMSISGEQPKTQKQRG